MVKIFFFNSKFSNLLRNSIDWGTNARVEKENIASVRRRKVLEKDLDKLFYLIKCLLTCFQGYKQDIHSHSPHNFQNI